MKAPITHELFSLCWGIQPISLNSALSPHPIPEQLGAPARRAGPQDHRPDPQRRRTGGAQGADEGAASPRLQEGVGWRPWRQDG